MSDGIPCQHEGCQRKAAPRRKECATCRRKAQRARLPPEAALAAYRRHYANRVARKKAQATT